MAYLSGTDLLCNLEGTANMDFFLEGKSIIISPPYIKWSAVTGTQLLIYATVQTTEPETWGAHKKPLKVFVGTISKVEPVRSTMSAAKPVGLLELDFGWKHRLKRYFTPRCACDQPPLWPSDITGGRVHLDVWRIDRPNHWLSPRGRLGG